MYGDFSDQSLKGWKSGESDGLCFLTLLVACVGIGVGMGVGVVGTSIGSVRLVSVATASPSPLPPIAHYIAQYCGLTIIP